MVAPCCNGEGFFVFYIINHEKLLFFVSFYDKLLVTLLMFLILQRMFLIPM